VPVDDTIIQQAALLCLYLRWALTMKGRRDELRPEYDLARLKVAHAITAALYDQGGVVDVYALAVTRTKSRS